MKKYNKLVRDKIPEIIASQGKKCKTYIAVGDDYRQRLRDKLVEEVKEFLQDPSVEELADVQEVVMTIASVNKWNLESERITKNINRGGFKAGYILKEVVDEKEL